MREKIIISMPDLLNFLDMLQEYGQTRDHIEINNGAFAIKSVSIW